ncbi:MAG: hypothetical protein AAF467_09780 [Actinomycetota bacterium]
MNSAQPGRGSGWTQVATLFAVSLGIQLLVPLLLPDVSPLTAAVIVVGLWALVLVGLAVVVVRRRRGRNLSPDHNHGP